jgi:hypothetical protein
MYMAMGVAFGMMMICLVYYVHSARVAAELHAHHTNTRHILAKQRLGHEIDEQHYAEMLARYTAPRLAQTVLLPTVRW